MTPYYEPYWFNKSELEHFGIKGMKWGVRRYQNPDGTLTEAGRKRSRKYSNAANYYAWKAAKYDTKAENRMRKAEAKGKLKNSKRLTLTQILSARDFLAADQYRKTAQSYIDALYPKMRDIPWIDVEKQGVYLDMMNWKTPAWAKKYDT